MDVPSFPRPKMNPHNDDVPFLYSERVSIIKWKSD